MKKYFLVFTILVAQLCVGQNKIDSLVRIGIQYHDNGEYAKAIEAYNEALTIDPNSTLVNYELSMTYLYSGDNENAIKYSDKVIEQNKDYVLPAIVTKGSALDNLGKTDESIELFKKAISEFGDDYLIYYNLGVNYAKIQDNANAESAFISAIEISPNHASSHYVLAFVENQQNKRVQSLLSLYYFLLLEPSSKRAEVAYGLLKEQLRGNVKTDENNPKNINIELDSKQMDSEFAAAEIMIEMLEASNSVEENKNKSQEELFVSNTNSFFKVLGELNEKEKKTSFWWNFYVPFFYELSNSEYLDVFCYYISMSSNPKATEWLKANDKKLEAFSNWLTGEE